MHTVEPIRNICDLNRIKNILQKQSERNFILFILGINTGLRISDMLKLKVSDFLNKKYILIREQKTKKERKIVLTKQIRSYYRNYVSKKSKNEYLFTSRKGKNKPIGRIQAWRIINKACKIINICGYIGTHTMRKTFGYHLYKKTKDIALLQNILNHSSPQITLRYIGINQEIIDKELEQFYL